MTPDAYDTYIAEWKARQGVPADVEQTSEMRMHAQDAKDTSKDYCLGCGEQFRVCDMRLITRTDDPYVQYDDDAPSRGDPDYITKQHRVRMCRPCFKNEYETDEEMKT